MIDHITLHVSDFAKSKEFYLAALQPLGYATVMEFEGFGVGMGVNGKPDFWIKGDGAGKPTHISFRADSRKAVDEFYDAAIAAGATDNGMPGLRAHYHPNFYGAFIFDLDGNNIEAVCHDPE